MNAANPFSNPQIAPKLMEEESPKTCVFCGSTKDVFAALPIVIKMTSAPDATMCVHCIRSMEERMPRNWFRWLKRNDPERWETIVAYHRHTNTYLGNVVREARIDNSSNFWHR